MESSGSGPSPECGAGSIVWVRRRNGSWWPGKILGPEELPASHLTSPRTGTPVKLLGREDASVDWYNLEKSKRVKAFRCGEFDDCIERAESSQGMPPKKREKYARREDAILHALELEKELLRKQGKLDITPDNASGKTPNVMKLDAGDSDISNGKPGNSKPNQFLKRQQNTSKKSEIIGSPLQCEKEKGGNQPTSENDHAEFMPRMKGLQDLGLKSASAKEKLVFSGALDGSSKPIAGGTQDASNRGPTMGRTSDVKGEEQIGGTFRAKRSRCMLLPSEPSDGLDYKEIYPNQIEISASRFRESDSYPFARHLIEDNSSELMEDVESGSSESTSSELESESDSSQTEPDIDEEMASLSGAAVATEFKLDAMGRADTLEECGSVSTDESDESSLSGDISHLYPHDRHSVNEAVSKWRLKGKRNMRNLVKRSIDADSRGFSGSTFRLRSSGQSSYRNDCFYDDVDGTGFTAKDSRIDMGGFDDGEYSQTLRASKDRSGFSRNMIDWEHMTCENPAPLKWQDDKAGHFDPIFVGRQYFGRRTRPTLMDVDLKVQASYQKGPVPIVSLMSKLDGKAIIGHPIQIEALEDGSSETLLPTTGYFGNGLINHEGNTSLPSAWRTAKRTNFRVPRPHLSSTLGGDEGVVDHSFLHQERQPSLNKYNVGSFEQKVGLVRKNASHIPRSPFDRKFQRKMPKRVSLSSSQKTRTLSSIGIEQTLGTRSAQDRSSCQMDGLIKPESFRPTTVACIPVKLVFSRLLEKINRPPSKAVSRMIVPAGYAVRDSS